MNIIESMRIFVKVSELSSFVRTAESLGLQKASVTQSIQNTEALLGVQLLQRTTRRVQLTHDGQIYLERCKDLLSNVEEIQTLFQKKSDEISGRIRIDMPTGVAKNLIIPHLPQFLKKYPKIDLEISSTDRRVDLIKEGFDFVIRVGTLQDSTLIARSLGSYSIANCASPEYIKHKGLPEKIVDLKNHQLVGYTNSFGGTYDGFEYVDKKIIRNFQMPIGIVVNNSESYVSAALAGLGLIQVPVVGVKDLIEQKKLVVVMDKYQAESMPISLIYPRKKYLARRVQIFMDWTADLIQKNSF